ncbi:MAG: cytochrome bd-I oxidase subunit CydX [Pseudomonadota bacterium]
MWYFAWILGLGLAATVGILNAMWLELAEDNELLEKQAAE